MGFTFPARTGFMRRVWWFLFFRKYDNRILESWRKAGMIARERVRLGPG